MQLPGADTVLVRYGEMGAKSRQVQGAMEVRLVENLEAHLAERGVPGEVERLRTRPLIHTAEPERASEVAAETFGVVSASPARALPADVDAVLDALAGTAEEIYDGGSFAVRARRADKSFPLTSPDLEREGGTAVWEAVEDRFAPAVDLDDPDVTFHVEVREERAYLYLGAVDGPGGLPVGCQEPMVALVSGGIDSPVAAYEVMRSGSPVVPVYVDLGDYGGPDHEARAVAACERLQRRVPTVDLRPYVVRGGEHVAHLAETMERGRMLAFRRFLYRVAEHVAERERAWGIVTGEALGQKSSQTARNFAVTSPATALPVHRPLFTMDKNEIIDRAKAIGTYRDATIPAGCNRFAPDSPETGGVRSRIERAEPDDLFERAAEVAAAAERVEF